MKNIIFNKTINFNKKKFSNINLENEKLNTNFIEIKIIKLKFFN